MSRTVKENNLTITNVPATTSFAVTLNIALIKSEMNRLRIKECDYIEFCKIFK